MLRGVKDKNMFIVRVHRPMSCGHVTQGFIITLLQEKYVASYRFILGLFNLYV